MEKQKAFNLVIGVLTIGLVIAFVFTTLKITELEGTLDDVATKLGVSTPNNEIVQTKFVEAVGGTILEGTDKSTALTEIADAVYSAQHGNNYFAVHDSATEEGEDEAYTVLMTNSKGEAIMQDTNGYISVFKNDGNVVAYADNIYYSKDTNFIDILRVASEAASNGVGYITKADLSANEELDPEHVVEYIIDIEGYESIEKMYSIVGEEYAANMVANMKNNIDVDAVKEDTGEDASVLNLRFCYILEDGKLASGGCYMYFGEGTGGYWDNTYINWYIDYPNEVPEWSLDASWYDFDYDRMKDENDTEAAEELENMVIELYNSLQEDGLVVPEEDAVAVPGSSGEVAGGAAGTVEDEPMTEEVIPAETTEPNSTED